MTASEVPDEPATGDQKTAKSEPPATPRADNVPGAEETSEPRSWFHDTGGRKGVVIGLLSIAATAFFGLPGIVDLVHTETRTTRTVDARWHRAGTLPTSVTWATPTAVTYAAGEWVAVGSTNTEPNHRPAAWYSSDGQHWQAGTVELDSTSDTTAAAINAVSYTQGRWVAVGNATAFGGIDAAVWTSDDGVTWRRDRASDATLGGTGTQQMNTVSADQRGLVAAGYENLGGDANGAIWTSSDAVHWTRVGETAGELGGPGDQVIAAVARMNGRWIAAGKDEPNAYSSRAAVWTSLNGATWARVRTSPQLAVPGTAAIFAMSALKGTVVAVGATSENGDKDAKAWTSDAGTSWTGVSDDVTIFGGSQDQDMVGVASGGSEFIGVGTDQSSGEYDPQVWSSSDGTHWKKVLNDVVFDYSRRTELTAVTEHDGAVVAVGTTDDGVGQTASVWFRTAAH